jgi:hypothetical protein
MIVAAHQPHYLPWLGYLDKMAKADLFVVMDDLEFVSRNFHNRQRVKLANGPAWLTVPVVGNMGHRINDKQIYSAVPPKQCWQHQHWRTLVTHYGRARFFANYADELRDVYTRAWTSLLDLDLHMLALARRWLDISTPMIRSSQLPLSGTRTDRLIDLCRKVGARSYLSGAGGSNHYLDAEKIGRAGIGVIWQHFSHPEYPQCYERSGFAYRLGFLDLVLNCGPASRDILFGSTHPIRILPKMMQPPPKAGRSSGNDQAWNCP